MNLEGKYVTVTTQEECEAVQKKAFELGYSWRGSGNNLLDFTIKNNNMNIVFLEGFHLAFNFSSTSIREQVPLQTLLSL